MKRCCRYIAYLLLTVIPLTAAARPPKRFHEGPYLQIFTGALRAADDTLSRTDTPVGHTVEPAFGFIFGWNLSDPIAVEITGRYGTATTFAAREHLIRANVHFRWNWITDFLTVSRAVQFLPFLHAGPLIHIDVLPGDPAASDGIVTQWGGGASVGGGLSALIKEYLYVSLLGQTDIARRKCVAQLISGISTETYAPGWTVGWNVGAAFGVHF